MDEQLSQLNDAQREAVTTTEGFVRVIAGAGSGKTRALTHRFAYLVTELGILPGNILCVTFTNKAASELRRRIHNLTGDHDTGYINTFHGFCVSVLQEESYAVGYPRSFLVLDNGDIDTMLSQIYAERGLSLKDMTFSAARDMIEIQKLFKRPEYYRDLIDLSHQELQRKYQEATNPRDIIFFGYLWQEKKNFALDYNDLILFSLHIFRERPDILRKWQQRLEYIMIDEFQDIDGLQYELMEVLCGWHKNLFVVGDPDQTIYTWRGANVKYLLDFDQHFPGTHTIRMTVNYRSTPQILAVANSLIAKNRDRIEKELLPTLPSGAEVLCHYGDDGEGEAAWIAGELLRLHEEEQVPWRDMAVLYRAHYLSRTVEEVLLRAKIPHAIYSGVPFYERREVKDALCYLRLLIYRDDLSFLRVANTPRRNLGERRMGALRQYAEQNAVSLYEALCALREEELFRSSGASSLISLVEGLAAAAESASVSELLAAVLEQSGYERMLRTEGSQTRLDNLSELRQSAYDFEQSCGEEGSAESYLRHVALFTNSDLTREADQVRLMTVHAAKGLEFPVVFLCGLNEGIFPSEKTRTHPAMEEERRLAFVAMTRAQRRLYLTEASGRGLGGAPRFPSRFLLDIDEGLLRHTAPPRAELIADARLYVRASESALPEGETALFPAGQRVRHSVFGCGTVVDADSARRAHIVQFDDMPTPRAISFRARLTALE